MSKFNQQTTGTKTVNFAGGEAYKETSKLEFVSLLLTSFVQDQFYRDENDSIEQLRQLLNSTDKKFAAKAAIFARNKFGMRSITHVAAGEIAKHVKGEQWTRNFFNDVVFRVDDITEILSYYLAVYRKPIPNSLKKGLRDAFDKFDAYQLAKYRSDGKSLSLVDVVNMVHPKGTDRNAEALNQLVNGTLKSTDTWESMLTQAGQNAENDERKRELKADVWKKLLSENKLGYFALLRNLRNIATQAPDVLELALSQLVNEAAIKKSLVLPFRFSTAINEIEQSTVNNARQIIIALNKALDISVSNVPKFEGKTLVVVDESGSMQGKPIEIASLFAAILLKSNDADLIKFSDSARYFNVNPMDSTLTIKKVIMSNMRPYGTNFHAPFQAANKAYNRIIILSDMQGWIGYHSPVGTFNEYCKKYNCRPHIYSWDLQGYGTLQFPERNIYCLAGFSEKVFDIMKMLETDKNALVSEIEKIKIGNF